MNEGGKGNPLESSLIKNILLSTPSSKKSGSVYNNDFSEE
jgi:hypothetical protein